MAGSQEHSRDAAEGSAHEPYTSSHEDGNRVEAVVVAEAPARPVDDVEQRHRSFLCVYLHRLKGAGEPGPSWIAPSWDGVPAFLFTAVTLMVLAVIEAFGLQPYNVGALAYLPSFGASCCLVMCLLTSPGSQPRALILTHIVGAFFGVSWAHITNSLPKPLSQQLACAFAVSTLTALMMLTGALQPSASATTCLAAFHLYGQIQDKGFLFLVAPATLGPCVIVVLGWLFNNLVPWRHCYPVWW
ncbi:HPP family [Novymonas esmeraldas]|uniref:HPP family n=1 Tax=Novymonas esmeraldas TaxID=1808958 RepID=A0AAW0ERI4_9TRYP